MRLRWLIVMSVVVAFLLGYAALAYLGAVATPPGVPRSNAEFSTVTWTQSHYGGSRPFRTVTVRTDGSFVERFADDPGAASIPPDRRGQLRPDQLATLRELITSSELAAEQRRHRLSDYDCSDSATISITMADFRMSALDCGNLAPALPTFAQLSNLFGELASPVNPPGGA